MYNHILVPIDGSGTSEKGLSAAIELAVTLKSRLTVMHVIDELFVDYSWGLSALGGDVIDSVKQQGKTLLDNASTRARTKGLSCDTVLIESVGGRVSERIVDEAEKRHVDLIVMGTHGRRGLRRFAVGSDAEDVVRNTYLPVLLLKGDAVNAPSAADKPVLSAASA